jgi:hypothetical protein
MKSNFQLEPNWCPLLTTYLKTAIKQPEVSKAAGKFRKGN